MLNHELRHAYEDFNRQLRNKTKISDTKEVKLLFSKDGYDLLLGKLGDFGIFNTIFRALYLTSKVEQSAYGENVYNDGNFGKNTYENIKNIK